MRRRDPAWTVPLLLGLFGLLVLWLGRSTECLALDGGPTTEKVCSTTMSPAAVVFAVICWATGAFVWAVRRRER